MYTPIKSRADLKRVHRIVIKAGTSVVSTDDGYPCLSRMASIVENAARLVHQGKEVIIVTSGAVGVGRNIMNKQKMFKKQLEREAREVAEQAEEGEELERLEKANPMGRTLSGGLSQEDFIDFHTNLPNEGANSYPIEGLLPKNTSESMLANIHNKKLERQSYNSACAAAGQMGLMALYDTMFTSYDVATSQILVTSNDFTSLERRRNIQYVISQLLAMGIVPLINENDCVSANQGYAVHTDQTFSDNDSLAGLISVETEAELLVLLTDVCGVYDRPPTVEGAKIIDLFDTSTTFEVGEKSARGRGGMAAKVDAAMNAIAGGVQAVIIADGHNYDAIETILSGDSIGTLFLSPSANDSADDLYAMSLAAQENESVCSSTAAIRTTSPDKEKSVIYIVPPTPPAEEIITLTTTSNGEVPKVVEEMEVKARAAREGGRALQALSTEEREAILRAIAYAISANAEKILSENARDVELAKTADISEANEKRLKLTKEKLDTLCDGILSISRQDEPIAALLSRVELSEGLVLDKVTCPIGVLLIIFESRPDCLPQIAALAIRSGNGLLLKGGKEAEHSCAYLYTVIGDAIEQASNGRISRECIGLVKSRQDIANLLALDTYIDLVIPRGSGAMVKHIKENTRIPVMGHADGVCHLYLDESMDVEKAKRVCVDSKTDYPSACNAAECLLVHRTLLQNGSAAEVVNALSAAGVTMTGDKEAQTFGLVPHGNDCIDYHTEYGNLTISVKIVENMEEAIDHIHANGSGHTECILTEDAETAEAFIRGVDAACVMHNASTRFADGYRFGLGAEVGISTGRIHARGPVGVEGLLTTKWQLRGGCGNSDRGGVVSHPTADQICAVEKVSGGFTVFDFSSACGDDERRKFTHRPISIFK